MKRPRLSFFLKAFSFILIIATVLFAANEKFQFLEFGEEGEEEEGVPGVLRSMDLWSEMRTYPNKSMKAESFSAAFEQAKTMRRKNKTDARGLEMMGTTAPWTPLAPMNFAGRVLCLEFDPRTANVMWAGSASGGLWKTTNGGTGASNGINWTYVETGFPVLGVSAIAINPVTPDVMYVGTGEVYNYNYDYAGTIGAGHIRTYRGTYGVGILKSTDGGVTWTKTLNFDYSNLKGVSDIVIDPNNPSIVFAATSDGVYRTTNAGGIWTLLSGPAVLAMDLCYKPGSSSVLYVSCGNFQSAGNGIYKTTNANAATPTFTAINSGLHATRSGKIQLHISDASPTTVFASVGRDPNQTSHTFALYRSTNEGSTWTSLNTVPSAMPATAGNQGWYAHDVVVSPTDINDIYWAEMDVYLSTNAGAAFTRMSEWSLWDVTKTTVGTTAEGTSNRYVHADVHKMYFSPFSNTTMFICTDGGIFKSTNSGTSYTALNGGLQTAQIYSNMAVSQSDPDFMLGGMQDNEGLIYDGSPGCKRIPNLGDGFHCAISPTDENTCFAASYYLNIRKSVNRGVSWSSSFAGFGNPPSETSCFNSPFVMSKSTPATMYAGSYRIRKSTNTGGTWTVMGGALSTTSTAILYIAVAPTNANIVYISVAPAGATRSKIFKTINGGTSYTEITGTLPDRYYSDIEVDPANPNRLVVTLSGFGSSHAFLSVDGGANWSDIGTGLADVPFNTAVFDPTNTTRVYLGSDMGVYYASAVPASGTLPATTNLTWVSYNEGVEDAILVSDLLVTSNNKLRMGSFGRGLWERALEPHSTTPVTYKDFTVAATSQGNRLNWVLATQENVDRYEIEYGTDGRIFNKVATVSARPAVADVAYNYLHAIKNETDGFYRIKSVDKDGQFEYSLIREVKAQRTTDKFSVYPNPVYSVFNIRVPSQLSGTIVLMIHDAAGKLIYTKNIQVQSGIKELPVDISRVAAGNYQVSCKTGETIWSTKIIKVR